MTITQLKQKISETVSTQRSLINQLSEINSEIGKLNKLLHQMNMDAFSEYLKVGFTIELKNWFNVNFIPLSGSSNVTIRPGDVLELSKINKKSFVFKLTKHTNKKLISGNFLYSLNAKYLEETIHPNWQYRIQIEDMYQFLMRDPDFKNSFDNWINRENLLNELLNENK
jgi:hypothetical protein